jgi:hypothetical protein
LNTLIFFGLCVALLLLLLSYALRESEAPARSRKGLGPLEEDGRAHVNFLSQVRRAMAQEDEEFLVRAGVRGLRQRVKRERLRVALKFLSALHQDFDSLLRAAEAIARLSPEIGVGQEFERFRLTAQFVCRFRLIQLALRLGYAPLPQVDGLSHLISGFSVRLETAMKQLGERAALVAEMASSNNRGRVGLT